MLRAIGDESIIVYPNDQLPIKGTIAQSTPLVVTAGSAFAAPP